MTTYYPFFPSTNEDTPVSMGAASSGQYHGGNTYESGTVSGIYMASYSGVEGTSGQFLGVDILPSDTIQAVSSGMIGEVSGSYVYSKFTPQGAYAEGSGFMTAGEEIPTSDVYPTSAFPSGYI